MAARGSSVSKLFDDYKKQGLSDSEAMQKAMGQSSRQVAADRKAKAEKKKKPNWAEKLKMGVTKHLGKKYHSPAGRKYMAGEVKKYGK